jgi:hypothetical protein
VTLSSGSKSTRSQWGQIRSNWRSLPASHQSRSSNESSGQARNELLLRLPHGYGEFYCPELSIHRPLKQQCVLQGPVCSPSDTCKTHFHRGPNFLFPLGLWTRSICVFLFYVMRSTLYIHSLSFYFWNFMIVVNLVYVLATSKLWPQSLSAAGIFCKSFILFLIRYFTSMKHINAIVE